MIADMDMGGLLNHERNDIFMKYISEERLTELAKESSYKRFISYLLVECTELTPEKEYPWLTIDENTPKDRRLNLYWKGYGWYTGSWRLNQYWCDAGLKVPANIKPTHWQELPSDPL